MDADDLATLGASPPLFFFANEKTYPELPDVLQILHHAHAIVRYIPLVQMFQPGTGKAVTLETELLFGIYQLLTVLDITPDTDFRLKIVVTSAPRTWFFVPDICATEAGVHSAGCDLPCVNGVCLC